LQHFKEIIPDFSGEIDFILIDIGSGFGNEQLESFVIEQSYYGIVGIADRDILKLLDVNIQSTKIAIDSDGTIIYREGYGKGGKDEFRDVFSKLAS
tara:strand:+ start:45 stop:332 length:288 start_codon:yes stop_codon:yes gene_type:complete